jgi:hypothetical protein
MFLMSFPVGFASDYLVGNQVVSTLTSRKLFNSIANFGGAAGLVWLAYVGCNSTMAIAAMILTSSMTAGKYGGYNVRCHLKLKRM